MTEAEGRAAIVRIAREWLGTPWINGGRVKGKNGAVDCAQLPFCVYNEAGLIDPSLYTFEYYPPDWFRHRDEPKLLNTIRLFAHEVDSPKPGDLAVWPFGRNYSHVGIVMDWPEIIHADLEAHEVIYARGDGGRMGDRTPLFFSRW